MNPSLTKLSRLLLFIFLLGGIPLVLLFLGSYSQDQGKISVDRVIQAPFITQSVSKDTVLLFFGYVGCTAVCSPFLEELHHLYRDARLDDEREKIDVLFVNLLSDIEPSQADQFAKAFDPDFKGIYLPDSELRKIEREFQLLFSPSLMDKNELNHTDHLYLLQRTKEDQWHLRQYYFIHPLHDDELYKDLRSQKDLS